MCSLQGLPSEVLHIVAFFLVALQPLGPPKELIPLLLTSRSLYTALKENGHLYAKIFRFKFDYAAVARRSYFPRAPDLAEQLVISCELLRAIRRGDVFDIDTHSHLFTAYLLMLDNDGKNYAQLEWAGIHRYVDLFIRQRLWEGRFENNGWPVDSVENACALWLAWMTLRRDFLFNEPIKLREDFIILIFPYVLLAFRYPSFHAPPNHFHLPLNPVSQSPLSIPFQSGRYPIYPPLSRIENQVHFGARPQMTAPLTAIAARLLFAARRETIPITIPPELPAGLTPADYAELNKGKAAEVVRGARWDWNEGCPKAVNNKRLRDGHRPRSQEEMLEALREWQKDEVIEDGDEESRRWDPEWWRNRLCGHVFAPRPKFNPGFVFKHGSLHGVWQGRLYIPQAEAFQSVLFNYPYYPGYANSQGLFSEASAGVVMLPVFFNIEEHHRVCHCPLLSASVQKEGKDRLTHPTDGCGVIPTPLPSVYPPKWMRIFVDPMVIAVPTPPADADAGHGDASRNPLFGTHFPETEGNVVSDDGSNDTRMVAPYKFIQQPVDYSMSNAWFPGESIPSVSFFKRKAAVGERDEIVFAVKDVVDPLGQQGDWKMIDGRCVVEKEEEDWESPSTPTTAAAAASLSDGGAETKHYVYETHDPKRPSAHDEEKCLRCAEISAMRESEKAKGQKDEMDALAAMGMRRLEKLMSSVPLGRCIVGNEDDDDDDDNEDGMRTEPLNIESFGFSPFGAEDMPSSSCCSSPESSPSSPYTVLGDDLPDGEPPIYTSTGDIHIAPTRRVFDRHRVCAPEGCGGGVRDVVLTGETDARHAVWHRQRYMIYGRVRSWDGLVGFLRVDRREHQQQAPGVNVNLQPQGGQGQDNDNPLSHMFICGYIVNEKNFVGEWRMAAMDPLKPAWGGPVLMTRRDGEEMPPVGGVAR